ncbi:hypothetical protein [Pseudoroseomonas cervicalis]|uniref:hypothetical protein n=1 Tax=Teichococcus cervicalis TaxID=204525 RepID=UPI00278B2A7B|nr:hypothetical protein [Pseudoroseomonas cervicalis]MDQ1077971.1 hypothetical protein [Pseudoroseomonas cervicalis]
MSDRPEQATPSKIYSVTLDQLRQIFDAGADQGNDEATAHEWGHRPSRKRDKAFDYALRWEAEPPILTDADAEGGHENV